MGNSVKGTRAIVQNESGKNAPTKENEQANLDHNSKDKSASTAKETDDVAEVAAQIDDPNTDNLNSAQQVKGGGINISQVIPSDSGNDRRNSTEIPDSFDTIDSDNHDVFDNRKKPQSALKNQTKHLNVSKASFQKSAVVKSNARVNVTKSPGPTKPRHTVSSRNISRNQLNVKPIKMHLNNHDKKTDSPVTENEIEISESTVATVLGEEKSSKHHYNKVIRQEEIHKVEIKASPPKSNLKDIGKTEKSSQSLSSVRSILNINKKGSTKLIKRRALSEPVQLINTNTKVKEESALDILHEEQIDDEAKTRKASYYEQLTDTESAEYIIYEGGEEYEISSSLRSTTLDSRLFDSESSIVTHTSVDYQKPVSRYSENKQKLKQGLLDLYRSYSFYTPGFPLLPLSAEKSEAPRYWPPWMTVKHRVVTEDDIELAEEQDSLETIDMNSYEIEKSISQFHNLFHHEDRDIKNVYIVGESGTGKTAFCRHLIQQWCVQHQQKTGTTDSKEPMFSGVELDTASCHHGTPAKRIIQSESREPIKAETTIHSNQSGNIQYKTQHSKTNINRKFNSNDIFSDSDELDRYEFLFYIPLFFETNHNHIHDLIKTQFKSIFHGMTPGENVTQTKSDPRTNSTFLNELLDKESEKCLIVLDGLDAWRPNKRRYKAHVKSIGLPDKDPSKSYTVIVTSTVESLREIGIKATDSDLEVTLNGIEEQISQELISDAVERLNTFYKKRKKSDDMIAEVNYWKGTNYQKLPLILQSLVCLWYHSGAIGNTFCDIFSRILELQFKRFNDDLTDKAGKIRKTNVQTLTMNLNAADKEVPLPRYYKDLSNCQKNKELISVLSQLAWNTRIQSIKSFDSSSLEVHGFSRDDVSKLIEVGVLTQNKVPGFSKELHGKTVFFPDERIQDFLATTYIAILCRNTAYENIGHINLHTEKIRSVVDAHLDIFNTLEDIFQFSNLIVLLCGLYPPIIEQITQKIIDVVSADKRVLEFRNNLETESEENVCEDIQELISRCAHESLSVNTDNILVHIGDIFYGNIDSNHLAYVMPTEVKSVLINVDDTSVNSSHASKFIHQTRIFDQLQKLLVKDETSRLSLQDIDSIHILSERCAPTLNVVSYIFNNTSRITYLQVTQDLDRLLPKMSNLLELELKGMKLSHIKFCSLAWVLPELNYLKRLQLSDITCEMDRCDGEGHKMDFSQFEKLEYIDIGGRELSVVGVNKGKLHTCILGNLPQGPEIQTFYSLRKAKCLKHFTQKVRLRPPFISQTLIQTLNTWHRLETLNLHGINFGENELILNKEMKCLAHLRLVKTRMSRIAWHTFVDCLPCLDQAIVVVTRDVHVTPIEEDVTRDSMRRPIDAETRALMLARETEREIAFDYVRGKLYVFNVLFDMRSMFDFEKKPK
ncbi:uncharacterized protein LOC123536654 [Mercenaria mercenaria]|uniref:uncharacterized protein LOC123536654 n=1 Tax=Mercenaria mercenaria TaxID=6596 RepID=UPI00234F86B9|nr:uncharacterized protein LOC123536654 [Mercenaria mercenaria]